MKMKMNKYQYKQNPNLQDRINEARWRKTGIYLYYGLSREQIIQIEKDGYYNFPSSFKTGFGIHHYKDGISQEISSEEYLMDDFIRETKDGVKHFSVPLTEKYTVYSCFALPNSPLARFAGLIVKAKNNQDNSENLLWTIITFDKDLLDKDLLLKKSIQLEYFNSLLARDLNYLMSREFIDVQVEDAIASNIPTTEELVQRTRKEFTEIFETSNLANKSGEEILKEIDKDTNGIK